MKYLIIKCQALDDQSECDADRTPLFITDDFDDFDCYDYEIYEIKKDGTLELIKEYFE